MKKAILTFATLVFLIIVCIFLNDGWVYLLSSLMALPVIYLISGNRRWVTKITRWAKANSLKTQVLITFMQLALFSLAILAGHNFRQLGYDFAYTTPFTFSALMIVGFLFVPFLPKRRTIAIPQNVRKHRLAFLSITLSIFVLLVVFGNKIEEIYPNSLITRSVQQVDQAIFPVGSRIYEDAGVISKPGEPGRIGHAIANKTSEGIVFASFPTEENPSASEKKVKKMEKKQLKMMKRLQKYRLAYAGGLSFGAVLLLMLLVLTSCAGICMILLAAGSIGTIALGALILGGSIWGMVQIFKGSKRNYYQE